MLAAMGSGPSVLTARKSIASVTDTGTVKRVAGKQPHIAERMLLGLLQKRRTTGPLLICLRNGNHYGIYYDSAQDNEVVVQRNCIGSRKWYWHLEGHDGNKFAKGFIETSGQLPMAATSCPGTNSHGGAVKLVGKTSDTGTIWVAHIIDPNGKHPQLEYVNYHCSGGNDKYGVVLAADNTNDHPWELDGHKGGTPGLYRSLHLTLTTAPAAAHTTAMRQAVGTGQRSTAWYNLCDANYNHLKCMRDPSDGGRNTQMRVSVKSGAKAEQFGFVQDFGYCGGYVSNGCGFPKFFFNRYHGHKIVEFPQRVSGECMKYSKGSSWKGVMGDCGSFNTLGVLGSCDPTTGYCFFPWISASESAGSIQWMCSTGQAESRPYTAAKCTYRTWAFYPPGASAVTPVLHPARLLPSRPAQVNSRVTVAA
jgi:hypothetical protein